MESLCSDRLKPTRAIWYLIEAMRGLLVVVALVLSASSLSARAIPPFVFSPFDTSNLWTSVSTDRSGYGLGEQVNITIIIENQRDSPVTLHFPDGCPFSYFVVEDVSGASVYNWKIHIGCPAMVGEWTFMPGVQVTENFFTWNQIDDKGNRVQPGNYVIRAVINSYEPESTATTQITIQGGSSQVMLSVVPWVVIAGVAGSSLGLLGWRRRKNGKASLSSL